MIINHTNSRDITIQTRLETLTADRIIELTVMFSDGFPLCRTVEMTVEQTNSLIATLQRLVGLDNLIGPNTPIEDLHERAEQLIRDAGQEHMLTEHDIQLVVEGWTEVEGGVTQS